MNNSNTWKEIYKNTTFGNKFASSYFVSLFYNRIKPVLLKHKRAEEINVLDFGCSLGANSKVIEACGMHVFGIDVSEIAIEEARKNVKGRFEVVNLLENNTDLKDVFGGRTFDFIMALDCMYLFTDKERNVLNKNFYDAMEENGVLYISMNTYDMPMYESYKNVAKDERGMVSVTKIGSVDRYLEVNLPRNIEEVENMFNIFDIVDVITIDMPMYSNQHSMEYHLLARKNNKGNEI